MCSQWVPTAAPDPYPTPLCLQLARASPPAPFTPLDASDCAFVDTPAALADLMDYLEGTGVAGADCSGGVLRSPRGADGRAPVTEVALDLEAHSVRSFQGFVCLMQVRSCSTLPRLTAPLG